MSDIANIAQVVGAIAVVVSLIYVGIQINDNASAVRTATANETATAISSWYAQLGTSSQSTDVFVRGVANPDSLTPSETAQFIYLEHGLFFQYQGAFYLAEEGALDTELMQSLINTVLGVREQPGFLMYWEQRGNVFQASFRAFVDDLIANGDTDTNFGRIYQDVDSK